MNVKTKEIGSFFRKYPLSTTGILCTWLLCLAPVPETPLSNISLIDKWTHVVMFAGLTLLLWGEYAYRHRGSGCSAGKCETTSGNTDTRKPKERKHPSRKTAKAAIPLPGFIILVIMGGAIEIVQETCTNGNRSGDVLDFMADAVGVCTGILIGIPPARTLSRRNKDSATD